MSLWKRAGCQAKVESFEEVDCSKNRQKARLGFVKSIQNRLRKIKNSIESRLSWVETSLAERKNGVRFQKEELA